MIRACVKLFQILGAAFVLFPPRIIIWDYKLWVTIALSLLLSGQLVLVFTGMRTSGVYDLSLSFLSKVCALGPLGGIVSSGRAFRLTSNRTICFCWGPSPSTVRQGLCECIFNAKRISLTSHGIRLHRRCNHCHWGQEVLKSRLSCFTPPSGDRVSRFDYHATHRYRCGYRVVSSHKTLSHGRLDPSLLRCGM